MQLRAPTLVMHVYIVCCENGTHAQRSFQIRLVSFERVEDGTVAYVLQRARFSVPFGQAAPAVWPPRPLSRQAREPVA